MKTTSFNGWIAQKLASYLTAKEGCIVEDMNTNHGVVTTTISDAFGYVYQIEIKMIGRKNQVPQTDAELKLFNIKAGGF